jgi:hypothetical protein
MFWVTVPLFVLVTLGGGTLSGDPTRLMVVSLLISTIVEIFKTSKQAKQPKPKTYLDVVTELLQGDRAAAIRLFNYNKEKFGGKTDEWLWQKVIRDIERDRR